MRLRDGDYCRSHDTVIRVYDEAGNVIETRERAGEFKGVARTASCADRSGA